MLPEDGPLRVETCWEQHSASKVVLVTSVCTDRYLCEIVITSSSSIDATTLGGFWPVTIINKAINDNTDDNSPPSITILRLS